MKIIFIKDKNLIKNLIKELKKGIKEKNNLSYATNVIANMTRWNYFLEGNALKYFDKVKKYIPNIHILEAWGNIYSKNDFTKEHDHVEKISGILYLNTHPTGTYFNSIDKEITAEAGKIILFNGNELHSVKKIKSNKKRYVIAFNGRKKENFELNI